MNVYITKNRILNSQFYHYIYQVYQIQMLIVATILHEPAVNSSSPNLRQYQFFCLNIIVFFVCVSNS